ncbi:hypothetical protein F5X99DRAFT_396453 [Biscogniauxia marginata]|nr:hypothetical protein F5X99DRAFT_396453 [Biscogniauxia marginata]
MSRLCFPFPSVRQRRCFLFFPLLTRYAMSYLRRLQRPCGIGAQMSFAGVIQSPLRLRKKQIDLKQVVACRANTYARLPGKAGLLCTTYTHTRCFNLWAALV